MPPSPSPSERSLLGALCLTLLVLALRRLLGHHEEVVTTMLQRYDHRLAEFAQTLNDALNQTLPARITAAISGAPSEAAAVEAPRITRTSCGSSSSRASRPPPTQRSRSWARSRSRSSRPSASRRAEVAQVGGLGVPDYRGARAIQVSFDGDDAPRDANPIRSGLAIPLLDSPNEPGMLAVLTRTPDRRFSEIDITSLENVLSVTRPALETSLELREPDPVPERDPLTDLYDRPAFHALLDREIGRARGRREQMALLVLDVDRLTTINARIGHLAADDVLATSRAS